MDERDHAFLVETGGVFTEAALSVLPMLQPKPVEVSLGEASEWKPETYPHPVVLATAALSESPSSSLYFLLPAGNASTIVDLMLGGDGWDSSDLDTEVVDGGYFTNHYSPDDPRPVVQDFVQKYQEKYGKVPDALATLAYDAANILFQSMESAGSVDPAEVASAMESGSFPVVSGDISYDDLHNPVKAAAMLQVKDGDILYVDTIAP